MYAPGSGRCGVWGTARDMLQMAFVCSAAHTPGNGQRLIQKLIPSMLGLSNAICLRVNAMVITSHETRRLQVLFTISILPYSSTLIKIHKAESLGRYANLVRNRN